MGVHNFQVTTFILECLLMCIILSIKHLKNTKLYSVEFLRTEMMSDLSN